MQIEHRGNPNDASKQSINIRILNNKKGREIIAELLRDADVLAENFRPGTLKPFGFDYESVKRINPSIIYVSISGYGQTGPLKNRAAFAPTVAAETGVAHARFKHTGISTNDFENMISWSRGSKAWVTVS